MSAPDRRSPRFLRAGPVIAVVTIERAADAVPLAAALRAGGMRVVEVTLRSNAALAAHRGHRGSACASSSSAPARCVRAADFRAARDAGAQFLVSPGFTAALHDGARAAAGVPWLPGVATPSEVLRRAATRAYAF